MGLMRLSPSRFADSSRSFSFSSFFSSQESLSVLKQKNPETIAPATLMKKQMALKIRVNCSLSIGVYLRVLEKLGDLTTAVTHQVLCEAGDAVLYRFI